MIKARETREKAKNLNFKDDIKWHTGLTVVRLWMGGNPSGLPVLQRKQKGLRCGNRSYKLNNLKGMNGITNRRSCPQNPNRNRNSTRFQKIAKPAVMFNDSRLFPQDSRCPRVASFFTLAGRAPNRSLSRLLPTIYSTVTLTALDGIPFATTTSKLSPVSMFAGTSKLVDTVALPVATPMLL